MPKKSKDIVEAEGQQDQGQQTPPPAPEGDKQHDMPDGPQVPPRQNNEVVGCVESAAGTITGCGENEIKNYLATGDFIARQLSILLADNWKGICKTARANGKDDKPAKVSLGVSIEIDHTSLLMMDTKIRMTYSEKHSSVAETSEDLTQTQFALKQSD
jgi:hypothetical protein